MIEVVTPAGTVRHVNRIEVVDADLSVRVIETIDVIDPDGSTVRNVYRYFSLGLSATTAIGTDSSTMQKAITTSSVTAIPEGGKAPYTYSWAFVSGDTPFTALSPTSASTAFRGFAVYPGEIKTAYFTCTATDANGAVAVSPQVFANVTNYGTGM